MTTVRIPREWFESYPLALGQEFDVTFRARVVALEERHVDVTSFGDEPTFAVSGEYVTLLLSSPRVPLSELERWPNPGSGAPCS